MGFVETTVTDTINFSLCGVVILVTALRLLSRKYVVPPMGLDDAYVAIATLFGIAYVIVLHFEISAWETLYDAFISRPEPRNGVQTEFEWDYYSQAVLLTIFDNVFQLLALTFSKLSLLAFYRRITTAKRSHRIILYVIEGILYCNIFTTTIPLLFSTRPLECYYDLNSFRGECKWIINTTLLLSANSAVQITVDAACFVLPWFVLWKLRISTANKVKVLTMYSFGIIAIVFSSLRIYAINRPYPTFLAYLEYQFQFMLWSVIEAFAPAICVSIPAIFGALFKIKAEHHSTRFSSKNKKHYLSNQNQSAASAKTAGSADKFAFGSYNDVSMSPMRPLQRLDSVSSSHYGDPYRDDDDDVEKMDPYMRQYRLGSY